MKSPVIDHLEQWLADLSQVTEFSSTEEKAEHIGLMNRIDTAIAQLPLCEKHRITGGSWFCPLPEIPYHSYAPEYRIVDDSESDNPDWWREVEFEDRGIVRLTGGDVVIKR